MTRGDMRDEIDFELLSNEVVASSNRVLTNVFSDDSFFVPGRPQFVSFRGMVLNEFNEFEVRWLPDRIHWFVNASLVREETTGIPDEPMTVRLNLWAPSESFPDAFDPALQPVVNADENRAFFYEVDFVEVRQAK
jgi:beta-glucanase (GH16 family)